MEREKLHMTADFRRYDKPVRNAHGNIIGPIHLAPLYFESSLDVERWCKRTAHNLLELSAIGTDIEIGVHFNNSIAGTYDRIYTYRTSDNRFIKH